MEMAHARHHLQHMHGGGQFYQVMLNLAEYRILRGRDSYHWDAEAWYGGDINRLWLKSEGEGEFGGSLARAEVQALLSHAVGPYFNLQGGLRYDVRPGPSRAYAAIGFEGLAPGFFEVEGFLFFSDKGDLLARAEAYYDQRITQRLILQPRVELNFAAQDVPANRIGAGLSDAELGLRLRYDIRREFAPYLGIAYERAFGDTARYRRLAGEDRGGWTFVLGARTWF
jgi:copper resistance protein B